MTYACDWCHSRDPNDPLWDPYDPELIRYCTTCHNEASIHTIDTHYNVGYVDPVIANGWDALGFHAGGSGSIPISYDSYTANEMCWGCHSDWGDVQDPLHLPYIHLNPQGISPAAVQAPSFVELRGGNFGDTQETGRAVQLKSRSGSMDWTDMPIQLWSDDYITLEIPCGTLDRGNYWVRVQTEEGVSNQVGFTFIDNGCGCGCLRPAALPCTGRITLQHPSGGYGMSQDVISAPGAADGQYKIVDLVSSQGTFTALAIVKWQSDKIKIKVADFFQDLEPRNYLQDVGEPTLSACDAIDPDTFSVYVRYITYSDDDQTGNFSAGDALLQVESDLPYPFALTEDLYIAKTKPRQCTNRSRLVLKGIHFGDTQEDGVVRIGRKLDAQDPSLGKGALLDRVKQWHTDKVVVQLKVKSGWEGKNRFVWIEKNGVKSNYQKVRILPPLP